MNAQERLLERLTKICGSAAQINSYEGWEYIETACEDAIAQIQRLDRHMERLGQEKPMARIRSGRYDFEAEYDYRINYAIAHRFEDES